MAATIDYYFTPHSPWTYLGHARFTQIAREAGAAVRLLPVDLGGLFPVSGGLPLNKRAPQRQAYRLLELRRFGDWLGLPINVQPRFFPVSPDGAARLIIAVDEHDGTEPAMQIAGAALRAVWVEERNLADEAVLAALLDEQGLDARRLDDAHTQAVHERYELDTRLAIEAGVFGAPSYVIDGEIFWGQDRLGFVKRRLAALGAGRAD